MDCLSVFGSQVCFREKKEEGTVSAILPTTRWGEKPDHSYLGEENNISAHSSCSPSWREGRTAGIWSNWSHYIHSQEAEKGRGWCSASFLLYRQPRPPSPGMAPSRQQSLPYPLTQPRKFLMDVPRGLLPTLTGWQSIRPITGMHSSQTESWDCRELGKQCAHPEAS